MLVTRSGQSVKSVLLSQSLCKYFKDFFSLGQITLNLKF